MFVIAVISAAGAAALLTWAVATGGRLLDYPGGAAAVRQNFKLWHIAIAAAFLVAAPWGVSAGMSSAGKASVVNGYKQFLNGALVSADTSVTECHRDGDCVRDYDCDSYVVKVVDQDAYTDSNGTYHSEQSHYETRYHSCPEATREYTYTVTGTFGFKNISYTIAGGDHIFALHPQAWRSSDRDKMEPGVPRGVPALWQLYKRDIEHRNADPITAVDTYTNYVLASQDTILKAYSSEVDSYLKRGLLPEHTEGFVKGNPFKDQLTVYKMSFVGFKSGNAALWQKRLMHFNAALGMTLQGDLHMVAIDDKLVGSGQSEAYANAIKAYWQGPKMGKKALAKNGIIVVLGVDRASRTISWARANTGMPVGNGEMISAIESRLPGKPFDPAAVLGNVRAAPVQDNGKPAIKYSLGYGALTSIMFRNFPFARACMQCKDKTDNGTSLVYLEADIKVPFWAQFLNVFLSVVGGIIGVAACYITSPAYTGYPQNRPRYY